MLLTIFKQSIDQDLSENICLCLFVSTFSHHRAPLSCLMPISSLFFQCDALSFESGKFKLCGYFQCLCCQVCSVVTISSTSFVCLDTLMWTNIHESISMASEVPQQLFHSIMFSSVLIFLPDFSLIYRYNF